TRAYRASENCSRALHHLIHSAPRHSKGDNLTEAPATRASLVHSAVLFQEHTMLLRISGAATLSLLISASATAAPTRCEEVLKKIGKELADVHCFESTDLTTNGAQTTPANNSIPTLPAFAFTPVTDRGVIAPSAGKRPPITKVVPGVQIDARIASDPTGQARFLLRLPNDWNGRLVVAGSSGTRSEFNGDFAWSDFVVQKGYAYASQNKGTLNFQLSTAADPLACRLNP